MKGRDLIVYILKSGLEDRPVFEDGKFLGFITIEEAAEKMNVGVATINTLILRGVIECIVVGNIVYIPADFNAKGVADDER